jgi:hypothetical protein
LQNINRCNNHLHISVQDQQEDAPLPSQDDSDNINGQKPSQPISTAHSKLRTLKDRMWVREALEDLTAAEFACSLAASTGTEQDDSGKNKKNSVDFENILAKLEKRIEDMCVVSAADEKSSTCIASYPVDEDDGLCWNLKKNVGMGSVTYTDDQRDRLRNSCT